MDDWKSDLTPKQLEAIAELRTNAEDVTNEEQHDDFFLFRYLKARKFDVKKAEQMLRSSLQWRASYGTDRLLDEWQPPEVMRKYWPGGVFGHDKEGHPILWQLSKGFDAKSMVKCIKKPDIVKYHVWRMEKVMRECEVQTQKRNRRIHSSMHISDLDGFNLGMVFLPGGIQDGMKQAFAIFEANYPENLHSSYVINAPAVFPAIFNILKPFLSEETKRKVHILGRNWQEELFSVVDKDQIPVYWGGTAMDPDDKCSHHINHGQPVPQKYFISEQVSVDRDRMATIMVIRGTSYNLSYDVRMKDTLIRWIFETEGHDIGFVLYYSASREQYKKKQMTAVVESRRCDSHIAPEYGNHTCQQPGVYVLQFDNAYSWVNSKTVHYEVELLEPDEDMIGSSRQNGLDPGVIQHLDSTHL